MISAYIEFLFTISRIYVHSTYGIYLCLHNSKYKYLEIIYIRFVLGLISDSEEWRYSLYKIRLFDLFN